MQIHESPLCWCACSSRYLRIDVISEGHYVRGAHVTILYVIERNFRIAITLQPPRGVLRNQLKQAVASIWQDTDV